MNRPLHRAVGWLLLTALALACLWHLRPPRSTLEPVRLPPVPALVAAATPVNETNPFTTNSSAKAEAVWNRWRAQLPAAKPAIKDVTEWPANRAEAFEKFRAWQAQYRTAADKTAVEAEGVTLAKTRRTAMTRWIERDPEFALAQAVGPDARRELPAAVLAELERWVEGRGGLEVLIRCGPEVKLADQTARNVRLDGEIFQTFVYGRRLGQTTKYDLPIHGVAVDGKLALHSSPVRQLEPGEVQARGLDPQAIHLETGGEVTLAAHAQEALAIEARLVQRETGLGPYPRAAQLAVGQVPAGLPPGTAAFPPSPGWTLGGKRLLVIRVDFSDQPGGPFAQDGSTITTNIIDSVITQANQFIVDNSQNLTSIATTMVPVVLRLPRTKAAYASLPEDFLRNDALTAAAQYDLANGSTELYNPSRYDFDSVVFSRISGGVWQFDGLSFVGAKGMWVNGKFEFRVLAHELGHNYGLYHANRLDVTGTNPIDPTGTHVESGDDFDMMGRNLSGQGLHFNEWFKAYLGWLSWTEVKDSSGTFRLFCHDNASASGRRAIGVLEGGYAYWLGYRRQHPTNSFLNNGLEIRRGHMPPGSDTNTGLPFITLTNDMDSAGSVLLNMTPTVTNFSQHPLPLNQTFTDSDNFVSFTPVAIGGTSPAQFIDVNVQFTPPTLITQPLSLTGSIGDTVVFSVDAVGHPSFKYQWKFNTNSSLSDETNQTFSLTITNINQAGYYRVQVRNWGGIINSVDALLTVLPPPASPVVILHPVSVTVPLGSNATFNVLAAGDLPLSYQWLFNGNPILGATSPTLDLFNVPYPRVGYYTVVVFNNAGTATSLAAYLDVLSIRPVAHWRFDEAPGSTVAVDSAGQVNGALSTTGSAFVTGGVAGNAINLNATADGHVNMGDNFRFLVGSFTFVGWVRTAPGESRPDLHIIGKHDDTTPVNGYLFHVNRGQNLFGQPNKVSIDWGDPANGSAVVVTSTSDVNNGLWHQVVAVHEAGGFTKIYVDGTPMEAQLTSRPMVSSSAAFMVGGYVINSMPTGLFQGLVDDIQLYNRALTDAEIDYLFEHPGDEITGAPLFVRPPQSISAGVGATASFTATLIGVLPFTYQWRFNGTNLPGATNLTLTLTNVQTNLAGLYSLRVDNSLGFAISSSALLTVPQSPFIVTQPANAVVLAGSNATFTVGMAGTPPFTYQWRFNGGNISGANAFSLTVSNTTLASAGAYSVFVTNAFGSALSSNATLTVNSRPIITVQPAGRVASIASPVTFSLSLVGNSPFAYQWRFNGASIAGATNATHTISGVINAHTGLYSVLITNIFGSTLSVDASLATIPMRVFSPWGVTGGGTNTDGGTGVAVDPSGNSFVTGYFTDSAIFGTNQFSSAGGRDGFVAKYNPAGQLLWARRFGGSGFDTLNGVAADTNGNCYLVGTFEGNATLGTNAFTNTSPSAYSDVAIAKLDAAGTVAWIRTLGIEFVHDGGNAIALDGNGNVLVAGQSVLDTFAGSAINNQGRVLVAKYDNAGNPLWARKTGSYSGGTYDVAQAVGADASGNVYVTGVFLSPVATFGVVNLTNRGGSDAFLVKYDASGNQQWVRQFGGAKDDRANSVVLDSTGNAYVAGEFLETLQMSGTNLVAGSTNLNLFIARLGPTGTLDWARLAGGVFRGSASAVTLDRSNQVLVAGYFAGNAVFGPDSLNSIASTFDVFLTRLDTNGNFAFAQQAGGFDPGGDIGLAVATDAAGNAFITGYFKTSGAFGYASAVSTGLEDFFLVRYNAFTGNPAPSLGIRPVGGQLRLSWSVASPGYSLQLTPDLRSPSWSDAFGVLGVEASEFAMTNQVTLTNRFFRLRRP